MRRLKENPIGKSLRQRLRMGSLIAVLDKDESSDDDGVFELQMAEGGPPIPTHKEFKEDDNDDSLFRQKYKPRKARRQLIHDTTTDEDEPKVQKDA